jgi:prepilin-type N-terminal cleavage/methylation domain-containing protein/prepilin-type processing-associated H-X9-DG protein
MIPSRTRRTAGFTLIELLVVIAIIAILAAILFPVFAKAREKGRMASCQSNLKQMGIALLSYAQDFDESLPSCAYGNGQSTPWNEWPNLLPGANGWEALLEEPIQPYIKNTQVLICPSQTGGLWGLSGYGYSEYLYDATGWATPYYRIPALSNEPAGVAKISMVMDTYASGIYNDWDTSDGSADGMARVRYGNDSTYLPRHMGNATNVLFADGHVKAVISTNIESVNGTQMPVVNVADNSF